MRLIREWEIIERLSETEYPIVGIG
jgi:hypothetical protein